MFGFSFLFSAALWALPLAGIPILLHLLYRRKSPIVQFSTLRFIKSSIQRTAARKKVQRWLLLACRALLLALLIWALSQPVTKPASALGGSGSSLASAIVVDTSYSMLLSNQQVTLLQKANDTIEDLLQNELRDAQVAIFRSRPASPNNPPHLEPAADFRGDRWASLAPTPSPVPLIDRIAAATDLLNQSDASRKWLIIITDTQAKEFPRPIQSTTGLQTILIDLHPPDASAAGITRIFTTPDQPRLGLPAQAAVDITGRADDSREVTLSAAPADHPDQATPFPPLPMARIRATGTAELSTALPSIATPWLLITAHLTGDEPLAWAQSRTHLVHVPPRQPAAIFNIGRPSEVADRMIRLALDPSEGQRTAWPIEVRQGEPQWNEALVAAVLTDWPDEATIQRLSDYAQHGGVLVLFIQPGLESTWSSLSPTLQSDLAAILPSVPGKVPDPNGAFHGAITEPNDPLFTGLGDDSSTAAARLVVTRLVPFSGDSLNVTPLIKAIPTDPDSTNVPVGLLWRRPFGDGTIYTWATLPDRTSGNLRVSEIFPPSLVNATLKPASDDHSTNVEIGQPINLDGSTVPPNTELDVTPPGRPSVKVDPTTTSGNPHFIFSDTAQPGLYLWSTVTNGQSQPIAWTNVQIPADEAKLTYRPLPEVAPPDLGIISGHSLDEVRAQIVNSEESQPHWSWAIAAVLFLLCLEATMGSMPKTWTMRWPRFAMLGMVK